VKHHYKKTDVLFDDFIEKLKIGEILDEDEFELLEYDAGVRVGHNVWNLGANS